MTSSLAVDYNFNSRKRLHQLLASAGLELDVFSSRLSRNRVASGDAVFDVEIRAFADVSDTQIRFFSEWRVDQTEAGLPAREKRSP